MPMTAVRPAPVLPADRPIPVAGGLLRAPPPPRESAPAQAAGAQASAATAAPGPWARLALELQAAVLAQGRLVPAAQAAVCLLAPALGARRVSIARLNRRRELLLLAASDGQGQLRDGDTVRWAADVEGPLLGALAECVDQGAPVRWPPAPSRPGAVETPRITVAHRALSLSQGGGVVSTPLVHQGETLGALCVEWASADAANGPAAAPLEHLTAWLAPVLALMVANERRWHERLRDGWTDVWTARDAPHRRRWRALWAVGAAAAVLGLIWPVTWHVGGAARLEGGTQRVLAAPADGFIERVHARPGDRVRAGQVLLELADRDLQLERQRWQSQLAQQQEAVAAAQARSDRAALAQGQAKADEAQAQLDLVEQRLARSRLVAPFDAVVVQGELSQQLGAPVKQGADLITLAPQGQYRVIVDVDEHDIARVRVGQGGALALSALPWETLPLTIVRVSPVARAVEGRNVFEVEASVDAAAAALLQPGWLGQGRVEVGQAGLGWQALNRLSSALRLWWWRWFT